jgi:hypothetical protein
MLGVHCVSFMAAKMSMDLEKQKLVALKNAINFELHSAVVSVLCLSAPLAYSSNEIKQRGGVFLLLNSVAPSIVVPRPQVVALCWRYHKYG